MFILAGDRLNNACIDNCVAIWSYLSLVAPLEIIHVGSLVSEHELEDALKGKCQSEEKQHLTYGFTREKGWQGKNRRKNYRFNNRCVYLQPAKKGKER